jgi:uncharacterized membrane protein YraQ (UPF0718 family)
MHLIFKREEDKKAEEMAPVMPPEETRPLWKTAAYFGSMVAILVSANLGRPDSAQGIWYAVHSSKWAITALFSGGFALILIFWLKVRWFLVVPASVAVAVTGLAAGDTPLLVFAVGVAALSVVLWKSPGEGEEWLSSTWVFAKQILPLLLVGVLIAGALLGRPDQRGLIPSSWIAGLVGGNSIQANLFASVAGAFMYFATLTEVPILRGLLGAGMGKGPALALLLAGPALSLPNMLVIRSVIGTKRTLVFTGLICVMATICGKVFGMFWG